MPAERSAGPSIATANGNIVLRTDSELELHSKTGTLLLPTAVDTITEKQGALEASLGRLDAAAQRAVADANLLRTEIKGVERRSDTVTATALKDVLAQVQADYKDLAKSTATVIGNLSAIAAQPAGLPQSLPASVYRSGMPAACACRWRG